MSSNIKIYQGPYLVCRGSATDLRPKQIGYHALHEAWDAAGGKEGLFHNITEWGPSVDGVLIMPHIIGEHISLDHYESFLMEPIDYIHRMQVLKDDPDFSQVIKLAKTIYGEVDVRAGIIGYWS